MTEINQIFYAIVVLFACTFGLESFSNLKSKEGIQISRLFFGCSIAVFIVSSLCWAILPSTDLALQTIASTSLIGSLFLQTLAVRSLNNPVSKKLLICLLVVLIIYGAINEYYRLQNDYFAQVFIITTFIVISMLWMNYEVGNDAILTSSFHLRSLFLLSLIEVMIAVFKMFTVLEAPIPTDSYLNGASVEFYAGMSSYCLLLLNFYLVDGVLFERTLIPSDRELN